MYQNLISLFLLGGKRNTHGPRDRDGTDQRLLPFQSGGAVRARYDVIMDAVDDPVPERATGKGGQGRSAAAAWAEPATATRRDKEVPSRSGSAKR